MTIPEGKRCATCKHECSGCEDLDFSRMKVLKRMSTDWHNVIKRLT